MRAKFCFSLALLLYVIICNAQERNSYSVNGVVGDGYNEPLFMASVVLRDKYNKLLAIASTNERGEFAISTPDTSKPGYLIVSLVGYSAYRRELVFGSARNLSLGTITLKENAVLDSVVITAPRIIRTTDDAFIYDVEKDPAAKNTKILFLLEKLPFIEIGHNNTPSIFGGSTKIKYLLNGKPNVLLDNPALVMRLITGINIRSIELIPNPPDNYIYYDAVINIITKAPLFDGVLLGFKSNSTLSGQDFSLGPVLDIVTNINKFSLVLNGTYNRQSSLKDQNLLTFREDLTQQGEIIPLTRIQTTNLANSSSHLYRALLACGYDLSKKQYLSLTGYIFGTSSVSNSFSVNTFAGNLQNNYNTESNYSGNSLALDMKASYSNRVIREKGFNIDYSLVIDNGNSENRYKLQPLNDSTLSNRLNANDKIKHTVNSEFNLPFGKNNSITVIANYNLLNYKTYGDLYYYDYLENVWTIEPNKTNYVKNLQHNAEIQSGYSLKIKKRHSLSFRVNLALCDNTYYLQRTSDEGIHNTYWILNPSFTYSIIPKFGQNIKFLYRRTSKLPTIRQINPYVNDLDPLNISTGNPYLKLEKTDNINLSLYFQRVRSGIGLSANYSHTWNSIERYSFINQDGANVSTYDNIGSKDIWSARMNYSYSFNRRFKSTFTGSYTKSYYNVQGKSNVVDSFLGMLQGSYSLDKLLKLSADCSLIPTREDDMMQSAKTYYNLTYNIKLSGNSKNMRFNWFVMINDILKSNKKSSSLDVYNNTRFYTEKFIPGRSVMVLITFSVGNVKNRSLYDSTSSSAGAQ